MTDASLGSTHYRLVAIQAVCLATAHKAAQQLPPVTQLLGSVTAERDTPAATVMCSTGSTPPL